MKVCRQRLESVKAAHRGVVAMLAGTSAITRSASNPFSDAESTINRQDEEIAFTEQELTRIERSLVSGKPN